MKNIIEISIEEFDPILQMIYSAKQKVERQVNATIISYGDTCPHIGGLGGGATHPAGIYSAAVRVSDEI